MADTTEAFPTLERVPSGMTGLDTLLGGGFFKGGTYFLMGSPGVGKTILGNQLCFNHVAADGRALYVSLLTETFSRMLAYLQPLRFFTPDPIGDALYYLSGYAALEQEGLGGLIALLRSEVRSRRATMLVIDGVITVEQTAPSVREWKRFLHDLHVSAEMQGCTTFLVASSDPNLSASQAGLTMVDGVVELSIRQVDMRTLREIQVHKLRGSAFLEGRHLYAITDMGLVIYPRTEAILALSQAELPDTRATHTQPQRMRVGITQLDEMLRGGIPPGSTTFVLGAAGTGKTLLGSHFLLEGARQGQKGLSFGFYETPTELVDKLNRLGLDASASLSQGQLEVLWQAPFQDHLDILAQRLFAVIGGQGVN